MDNRQREMQEQATKLFDQCNIALEAFEKTGNRAAFIAWQDQCAAFEKEFKAELAEAKVSIVKSMNNIEEMHSILSQLCPKATSYLDQDAITSTTSTTRKSLEEQILQNCEIGEKYSTQIKRVWWWQIWRWHLILAHRRECQRLRMKFFKDFNRPTATSSGQLTTVEDFQEMFENFGIPARIVESHKPFPSGLNVERFDIALPRYLESDQRVTILNIIDRYKTMLLSIKIEYTLFCWQSGSKIV